MAYVLETYIAVKNYGETRCVANGKGQSEFGQEMNSHQWG